LNKKKLVKFSPPVPENFGRTLEPRGVASWDFATWRAARWGW